MGAFEIHQYQSALLGIINTTMSTKVTGNYSMTHDGNKKNELPKETEHTQQHTNTSEDSPE
jgi:hypothetical protein